MNVKFVNKNGRLKTNVNVPKDDPLFGPPRIYYQPHIKMSRNVSAGLSMTDSADFCPAVVYDKVRPTLSGELYGMKGVSG